MKTQTLCRISLAVTVLFLLAVLLGSLFFVPADGRHIAAAPVSAGRQMQGGDEPGLPRVELLPGEHVTLNTADLEQLRQLPGIGETLARSIVEYRERFGPFTEKEDLMQVDGIGEKTYAAVADWIEVTHDENSGCG